MPGPTGAADRDRSYVQERLGDVLGSAPGEPESDDGTTATDRSDGFRRRVSAMR